jgi:carbonic anhydrase
MLSKLRIGTQLILNYQQHLAEMRGLGAAVTSSRRGLVWCPEDILAETSAIDNQYQPVSPDAALKRLLEGNQRFISGKYQKLYQAHIRRWKTASAQYPFAAILGCADSRVPAEIVFDQWIGDLFVIRVAGNVASQTAIGSLEFATSVLGTQLIVVVGHSQCGAVAAAVKGDPLPGQIGSFVEKIKPAVTQQVSAKNADLQENAVLANAQHQAQRLAKSSTILASLIREGKLKIVGGHYDLRTGKFTIISPRLQFFPNQQSVKKVIPISSHKRFISSNKVIESHKWSKPSIQKDENHEQIRPHL